MNSPISPNIRRAGICIVAAAGFAVCLGTGVVDAYPSWMPRLAPELRSAEAVLSSRQVPRVNPDVAERVQTSERDNYVELLTRAGIAHFPPGQ